MLYLRVCSSCIQLRMVKMFGWEDRIKDRVAAKRETELDLIWRRRLVTLYAKLAIPVLTPANLTRKGNPTTQHVATGLDHGYNLRLLHHCAEETAYRCKRYVRTITFANPISLH